jgi:serine protease Do
MSHFKVAFISSLITVMCVSIAFAYFYSRSDDVNISADNISDTTPIITEPVSTNESNKEEERAATSDNIYESRSNSITRTVKKVSAAVVGINVKEIRQYRDPWSSNPFWRQFFGDRGVYNREVSGLGSGVIISPDGYIITNDHVAGRADEVIITMTNGKHYDARIVGSDMVSDVCLLKIEADNLPHVKIGDSDNIIIGEWAIALGNPFGLFDINDKPTVTVGVISSVGMNLGENSGRYYLDMIQTDAAINSGNSGGPLLNGLGELIGMNTLIFTAQGSSGSVGVGFAIPINKIKRVIEELKANGIVDRAFVTGLRGQTIDEGIAKYYQLPTTNGVIITYVQKDSPSSDAGLEEGDIILFVDKYRITNFETLVAVINEFRPGDKVNMKIQRGDSIIDKTMKLEKK